MDYYYTNVTLCNNDYQNVFKDVDSLIQKGCLKIKDIVILIGQKKDLEFIDTLFGNLKKLGNDFKYLGYNIHVRTISSYKSYKKDINLENLKYLLLSFGLDEKTLEDIDKMNRDIIHVIIPDLLELIENFLLTHNAKRL